MGLVNWIYIHTLLMVGYNGTGKLWQIKRLMDKQWQIDKNALYVCMFAYECVYYCMYVYHMYVFITLINML